MIDEVTERRINAAENNAAKLVPADALRMLLHEIETGELKPDHIIICWLGEQEGTPDRYGYRQAGKSRKLEAIGLLDEVKKLVGHHRP